MCNSNKVRNNLQTALFFPEDQEYIHKIGPHRNKTRLRGFQQSETQTSLLSYRGELENEISSVACLDYDIFPKANVKGPNQTARLHRLVCTFVVHKPLKTGFLVSRSNYGICSSCDFHLKSYY